MSYESDNIYDFTNEFEKFSHSWDNWNINHNQNFSYLMQFNTKLRMPFAIKEIELDYYFLSQKENDMKDLHKFLYKLTDLWFAYETFFKLYKKVTGNNIENNRVTPKVTKFNWLYLNPFVLYKTDIILNALNDANNRLQIEFAEPQYTLLNYLFHCQTHSKGEQRERMNSITSNINRQFLISDILTITYAIRNNYVHNGETTITNAGLENLNFHFNETQKLKLMKICYDFLAIFTVNIANKLIEQHS